MGKLGGDDIAAPQLTEADRDPLPRLAQVELAQLARTVVRALEGAWAQIARAQLTQVVVEDRLAAVITELTKLLADPNAGERRVLAE